MVCHTKTFSSNLETLIIYRLLIINCRVSQSLIMGTVSIANALAFTPNLQKGLIAAGRIINLLKRVPQIRDDYNSKDADWVN